MTEHRDTSAAAAEVRLDVFRRMSPAERGALALAMSDEARELAADGLRHRRPTATADEIEIGMRRILLGDELADRVERAR